MIETITDMSEDTRLQSSPPMRLEFPVLRSAAEILAESWTIYKSHFGTLVGISAIPLAYSMLSNQIFTALFGKPSAALLENWKQNISLEHVGIALVVLVLSYAVTLLSQVALLSFIISPDDTKDVYQSYKKGFALFGSFAWVSVLTLLSIVAGFALFIIPGVIIGVWFVFSVYVFMVEGLRGVSALRRSYLYVKGHWQDVFSRLIPVVVLVLLPTTMGSINFNSVFVSDWLALVLNPFITVYTFHLYLDVKALLLENTSRPQGA